MKHCPDDCKYNGGRFVSRRYYVKTKCKKTVPLTIKADGIWDKTPEKIRECYEPIQPEVPEPTLFDEI